MSSYEIVDNHYVTEPLPTDLDPFEQLAEVMKNGADIYGEYEKSLSYDNLPYDPQSKNAELFEKKSRGINLTEREKLILLKWTFKQNYAKTDLSHFEQKFLWYLFIDSKHRRNRVKNIRYEKDARDNRDNLTLRIDNNTHSIFQDKFNIQIIQPIRFFHC